MKDFLNTLNDSEIEVLASYSDDDLVGILKVAKEASDRRDGIANRLTQAAGLGASSGVLAGASSLPALVGGGAGIGAGLQALKRHKQIKSLIKQPPQNATSFVHAGKNIKIKPIPNASVGAAAVKGMKSGARAGLVLTGALATAYGISGGLKGLASDKAKYEKDMKKVIGHDFGQK